MLADPRGLTKYSKLAWDRGLGTPRSFISGRCIYFSKCSVQNPLQSLVFLHVTNSLFGRPLTLHPKVNVQIVFTGHYWHHFRELVNTLCNFALVIISWILITFCCDFVFLLILRGRIWCWLPLGLTKMKLYVWDLSFWVDCVHSQHRNPNWKY